MLEVKTRRRLSPLFLLAGKDIDDRILLNTHSELDASLH